MKILKITFQNLNSLKGKHTIDLENGLLAEAGIFSITGPTGAGKSTILDAITLALFGRAARYEKEPNPGEVMTRGTGECAAEVLFECSKGRYTAKWTRARARKKPDGKLQGSKREIAKADSGEILAEKLNEASKLVESLTGLDYHRFLRSVLLAQGRFKEFLDADDNERGELLEKITGTEIYSRIGEKAFEIERAHNQSIQEAESKLGGLQLKTEDELSELGTEKADTESNLKTLKAQLSTQQTKLNQFENKRRLTESLKQSEAEKLTWEASNKAFAPSRERLTQHEATQPYQAALIELDAQHRQRTDLSQSIQALEHSAQCKRAEAAHILTATEQHAQSALNKLATKTESTERTRAKTHAAEQSIATWIKTNEGDQAIEAQLPNIRALGESTRQTNLALKQLQSDLSAAQADQAKNNTLHAEKTSQIAADAPVLTQARTQLETSKSDFSSASESQTIEQWRTLAKQHNASEQAAQALAAQRKHWAKNKQVLTDQIAELPKLANSLDQASEAQSAQANRVAKEKGTLDDKQKIYDQSRLIAKLEDHRADLKPDESCPLCGSTEHPYADHLDNDENTEKEALRTQKQQLEKAITEQKNTAKALAQIETKHQSLKQSSEEGALELSKQEATLQTSAGDAGYQDTIQNDDAFTQWCDALKEQRAATEAKLEKIEALDRAQQTAKDKLNKLQAAHDVSTTQLQNLKQQQTTLAEKQEAIKQAIIQTESQLTAQLRAFNDTLVPHAQPATSPDETAKRTQALEKKSQAYNAQLADQALQQTQLNTLRTQLSDLQQSKQRLTEEQAHWQSELAAFSTTARPADDAPRTIADNENQRRSDCQDALNLARQSAQAFEQKSKDAATLESTIAKAIDALQTRLQASAFPDIDALKAARLDAPTAQKLEAEQAVLKTQHDTLIGRIAQTRAELDKIASEDSITEEEAAALKTECAALDEQAGTHNKRLGEITLLIEQDAQARKDKAEQLKKIAALHKEARPWIELCALIGSAKGDKFSKFAQGLTLSQLLQLANRHLLELNDRYYIQRINDSELGLQIVDRYQADAIRPTRSLSGGESFLVSLALALGLSDLAGSDTRIESLFIDEGFGTLDAETLDIALAALENLRTSNRTIGIISHVEALKHRISAQIQVSKNSNGYGALQIVNGA